MPDQFYTLTYRFKVSGEADPSRLLDAANEAWLDIAGHIEAEAGGDVMQHEDGPCVEGPPESFPYLVLA